MPVAHCGSVNTTAINQRRGVSVARADVGVDFEQGSIAVFPNRLAGLLVDGGDHFLNAARTMAAAVVHREQTSIADGDS